MPMGRKGSITNLKTIVCTYPFFVFKEDRGEDEKWMIKLECAFYCWDSRSFSEGMVRLKVVNEERREVNLADDASRSLSAGMVHLL